MLLHTWGPLVSADALTEKRKACDVSQKYSKQYSECVITSNVHAKEIANSSKNVGFSAYNLGSPDMFSFWVKSIFGLQ